MVTAQALRADVVRKPPARTLVPLVDGFLNAMTARQWELLKAGNPDDFTMLSLGELLMNAVANASESQSDDRPFEPDEYLRADPCDEIVATFHWALGVPDMTSVSCERLSALIREECEENVTSARPRSRQSPAKDWTCKRITSPGTLDKMVDATSKVLKEMMRRSSRKPSHKSRRRPSCTELMSSLDEDGKSDATTSSDESEIAKSLSREMSGVIDPFLRCTPPSQRRRLSLEIAQEIGDASQDISAAIGGTPDAAGGEPARGPMGLFQAVRKKVNALFTKCFTAVWIHRIKAQLMAKFNMRAKEAPGPSVQPIMDRIDAMLESEEPGHLAPLFKHRAEDLVFTQGLSGLLRTHLMDWMEAVSVPASLRRRSTGDLLYAEDARAFIASRVWVIIVLLNWWNTHLGSYSRRAALALMDGEPHGSLHERFDLHDHLAHSKKESVGVLTGMIAWRLFHTVNFLPRDADDITEQLLETTWADVEDATFHIDAGNYAALSQSIYRALQKHFGNANMFLLGLRLRDPVITTTIRHHLITTTRGSHAIMRFFSGLTRFFCKAFKRADKPNRNPFLQR